MTRFWRVLVLCAGALALGALPANAQTFEMVLVPVLPTDIGELPNFAAIDINGKGEVTGKSFTGINSAAVRFSAQGGLEDLDPDGEYSSLSFGINGKGEVLGLRWSDRGPRFAAIYIHNKQTGFELLENGLTDEILDGWNHQFPGRGSLPKAGSVFGSVITGEPTLEPYMYTKANGWTNLKGLHPRFDEEPTQGAYLNGSGYQVFVISGPSPAGEEPPTGVQDVFVREPNGRLHQLVSPGRPVTPGSRPNRKGRMAGLYLTDDAFERAYVFTPATGLVDIHPGGYVESIALGTNQKGVVFGALAPETADEYTELFVHKARRGLTVIATLEDFQALAPNGTVRTIYPEDINKKGDIVGCVTLSGGTFPFLYSKKHGLINLSEVIESIDPSLRGRRCQSLINDKRQLVVGVRDGDRFTEALLKFRP